MKAILEFDLPEHQSDHQDALDGYKWHLVCHDMDNWLRNQIKYCGLPEGATVALASARDELHRIIEERDVRLFE